MARRSHLAPETAAEARFARVPPGSPTPIGRLDHGPTALGGRPVFGFTLDD
ncbi:MAG TPA: hypothetical protein VN896_03460 [Methylomirabilota bacterium]|nr:hypothetical protein [Methylomirabilota bacterium]